MSVDANGCAGAAAALTVCMTSKAKAPTAATSTTTEINQWLIKNSKRKHL
ncbi:hypothetical protein BDV3_005809 [Batrachochytrium dendrobatidis]